MKKTICCILAACSLFLGACQSAPAQKEADTHGAGLSVIERGDAYYLHDRNGKEIQGYQYPNGNIEFHLSSGKWLILDENREVLYDDIDDMFSDYHAQTLLEDGTTLYRYFDSSGDLLLEGAGEDYIGWHYTGVGSCFYQLYWGATRVRNFDIDQEIFLPVSPSVGCLDMEMSEKADKLLLSNYEKERSYLVEEDLIVTELEGFYLFYENENGEVSLRRKDGTLCALDGTPLPSVFPEMAMTASLRNGSMLL